MRDRWDRDYFARAPTHDEHLVGRNSAITMVMLGEAVLQLTTGNVYLETHEAGTYRFAIAGYFLVFALAMLTFNTIPDAKSHALGRSRKRGYAWRILSARAGVYSNFSAQNWPGAAPRRASRRCRQRWPKRR